MVLEPSGIRGLSISASSSLWLDFKFQFPMNTTNAAVEQMAKYYWGMLGASRATTTAAGLRSWPPPAHGAGGGDPSWEELAFARDVAGHLGGCVWPPRSYRCTFCRREFRSAQALGGHMNVHRRDRARLRQCASPDHDVVAVQEPIAPPAADHHQLLESPLYRTKTVLISGPKSACDHHHQAYNNNREAVMTISTTTTAAAPPYISTTIIKESKSKVVISIPAATTTTAIRSSNEALAIIDGNEEEEEVAGRRKRRRVDQPPNQLPTSPFYLRLPASSPKAKGVEHDDAKVPTKATTNPSRLLNSLHLAGRQEVDLELRLGTH